MHWANVDGRVEAESFPPAKSGGVWSVSRYPHTGPCLLLRPGTEPDASASSAALLFPGPGRWGSIWIRPAARGASCRARPKPGEDNRHAVVPPGHGAPHSTDYVSLYTHTSPLVLLTCVLTTVGS